MLWHVVERDWTSAATRGDSRRDRFDNSGEEQTRRNTEMKMIGSSPLSLEPLLGPLSVRPMAFNDYTLVLHNIPLLWITMLDKGLSRSESSPKPIHWTHTRLWKSLVPLSEFTNQLALLNGHAPQTASCTFL